MVGAERRAEAPHPGSADRARFPRTPGARSGRVRGAIGHGSVRPRRDARRARPSTFRPRFASLARCNYRPSASCRCSCATISRRRGGFRRSNPWVPCGPAGRVVPGRSPRRPPRPLRRRGRRRFALLSRRARRPDSGDDFAGLHALWHGDRLRVADPSGTVLWIGPVLHDFDGRTLLPYVRVATWQGWFASGYPAELAMSADHARYLVRARRA